VKALQRTLNTRVSQSLLLDGAFCLYSRAATECDSKSVEEEGVQVNWDYALIAWSAWATLKKAQDESSSPLRELKSERRFEVEREIC
jgi:hypothetical protein